MNVERRFIEQSYQAKELPSYMECRQLIDKMEDEIVLSYTGPHGVQALQEQFSGTPIDDAFLDLPEHTDIDLADFSNSLHNTVLNHERTGVVGVGGDDILFVVNGEKKSEDPELYPRWIDAANKVRETALTLVPGMREPDLDDFTVMFTPMMKRSNQLLLVEDRAERVNDPTDPSGLREYTLGWHQYRMFEHNEAGIWHERGILTYFHVAEYDDMHDPDYPGEQDIVRDGEAFFVNQPAPPELFNGDVKDDPEEIVFALGRIVYAPLPIAPVSEQGAAS